MPSCDYCGADAPYSCDAIDEATGETCGRTVCAEHAVPQTEGAKEIGKATLCDDHRDLQKKRKPSPKNMAFNKRPSVAGTSADPTIKFSKLDIDGEVYNLAYSFNAIAMSEKLCGCNLMQGIASFLLDTADAQQYRGLLHAALSVAYRTKENQPVFSLQHAGAMIRIDTLPDIRLALIEAYNLSMPEKKRLNVEVVEVDDGNPPVNA